MANVFVFAVIAALLIHSIVVSLKFAAAKRRRSEALRSLATVRAERMEAEIARDGFRGQVNELRRQLFDARGENEAFQKDVIGYRELLNEERERRLAEMDRLNGEVIERNRLLALHVDRWSRIVIGSAWKELADTEKKPPVGQRYELRRVRRPISRALAQLSRVVGRAA